MRPELVQKSRIKFSRRRKALRKFFFFVFLLIILFFTLGLLSHLPKLTINEIDIKNTKALDKKDITVKIKEFLSGNKALFYARGNIFLFSKSEVAEFLKNSYPRIYEVQDIERDKKSLLVSIEERAPAYLWCGNSAPLFIDRSKTHECFFADQTGFIFDYAPFFTNGVYLAFYGGVSADNPIGSTISVQSDFKDFHNLKEQLASQGFPIHSVILLGDGTGEIILDLKSDTGDFGKILFDENLGLSDILRKVSLVKEETEFKKSFKEKPTKLLYIDARFKDKVFYKFAP